MEDIIGGIDSDDYERGKVKATQEGLLRIIAKNEGDIAILFSKLNDIPETVKKQVIEHQLYCPMKTLIEAQMKEKEEQTKAFRWFVGVVLSIVGICISILTALKILHK